MEPFGLRTQRLVLDQPVDADVDAIAAFCSDPVFERFMVTPWPYRTEHAHFFVDDFVPGGWGTDREWTWAIRRDEGAPLLGVVGIRLDTGMVGYWLGAPHRGSGVMPEALTAAMDAVLARTDRHELRWECVAGNHASVRVAEKAGFRFTGERLGEIVNRDGSPTRSWTARLGRDEDRAPKPGWPRPADGG